MAVLGIMSGNIHESLLAVDANYQLTPVLAERYDVSADGTRWTFTLRGGVRWHDGQPFTPADVAYNIDWVRDPANGAIGQPDFTDVERVETPDARTVVVGLKRPNAAFGATAATRLLVPKHVHERIGEKAYKQQPVGTGPYKLKELRPAEYGLLEANPDHWQGRPWIDFWRQNVVPEPSVRAIALQTQQADSSTWALTPEDTLKLLNQSDLRAYRAPGVALNYFALNNTRATLADKRVRQAMLYAIDRDALVKDLLKGLAVKATSNLSPALATFYEANVAQYPRDLGRARALLAQAGWTPGTDGMLTNGSGERLRLVCLVFAGDAVRRGEAEVVQRELREVGIDLELREVEPATALSLINDANFDMLINNWTFGGASGDPDPGSTLLSTGLDNFSHWRNSEADRLIAAGRAEADPLKRKQVYADLQKLVAEEVPFLFLMYWETVLLFSTRLKGMPEHAANPYRLYEDVRTYWIETA